MKTDDLIPLLIAGALTAMGVVAVLIGLVEAMQGKCS